MIHVCYGLYDGNGRYSKFTGTSILSMFENTRAEVTVHLLHDDTLTADNRDKFSYIAEKYNQLIKFYNVDKLCAAEMEEIKNLFAREYNSAFFSIGKFYRLLTPQLLSDDIEKIIYLDADIIVNLDISELWNVPIDDDPIAAVPESENGVNVTLYVRSCNEGVVAPNDYFNSGVVVLNLKHIRQNEMDNLRDKIIFRANHPEYLLCDQEILNYCFSTNYLRLPNRFNLFVRESRWRNEFETENRILHYLFSSLKLDTRDPFNALWFSYFEKTPWFNKDVITHMYENVIKLNVELKDFAAQVSALMSGKSRAFFLEEVNLDVLKEVFTVQEGEDIILAKDLNSMNLLKKSMKESAGKKIHFILIALYYDELRNDLMKDGFVEGRDFINALAFLSDAHGLPLDTHIFVGLL